MNFNFFMDTADPLVTTACQTLVGILCPTEVPVGYGGYRSTHRSDGTPKLKMSSSTEARTQALKQFIYFGKTCVPYRVNDGYYTGHDGSNSYSHWLKRTLL